jgi:hypothetical protein
MISNNTGCVQLLILWIQVPFKVDYYLGYSSITVYLYIDRIESIAVPSRKYNSARVTYLSIVV